MESVIVIYRWAINASFALLAIGFLLTIFSDKTVDSKIGMPLQMLRDMADLQPSGFFGAGIGTMILAPIIMLAWAAYIFFRDGDRRYGLITTAVTGVLSLSILIAFVKDRL